MNRNSETRRFWHCDWSSLTWGVSLNDPEISENARNTWASSVRYTYHMYIKMLNTHCMCSWQMGGKWVEWVVRPLSYLNWPFEWLAIACTLRSNKISLLLCSCCGVHMCSLIKLRPGSGLMALGCSCSLLYQVARFLPNSVIHMTQNRFIQAFQGSCNLILLGTQLFVTGSKQVWMCYQCCCQDNTL